MILTRGDLVRVNDDKLAGYVPWFGIVLARLTSSPSRADYALYSVLHPERGIERRWLSYTHNLIRRRR
jgi:hypothetical protein